MRTDTDHTTVISPRLHVSQPVGETTRVDATYAADVWSSASVDIRTSASVRPVSEQRDEFTFGASQELSDLKLSGAYRFSSEPDYTSHGVNLGAVYDLADKAANLAANVHAFFDVVGRSGNPEFARHVATYDGSISFTQTLDAWMFAQLTYEYARVQGFQASPYRFVGIGEAATGFGCHDAEMCLNEHVPQVRDRHAFAVTWRRAQSDAVSFGLTYRFYIDDWSLQSHTVLADLGWNLTSASLLRLSYRFYTQSKAKFYQMRYATLPSDGFVTRDKELSPLGYQRAGLDLERDIALGESGERLLATLSLSGNYYRYGDFAGLRSVLALEVTAALLLEM